MPDRRRPGRPETLDVAMVSTSDGEGGAARAALRLHRVLLEEGYRSRMIVDRAMSGEREVEPPTTTFAGLGVRVRPRLDVALSRLQRTDNPVQHSTAAVPGSAARRIHRIGAGVVNLHWVGHGCLSVRQFTMLGAPAVWTLHDMWAFTGAEHYAEDGPGARWRVGYSRRNRPTTHGGVDLDRWTWRRKRRHWQQPQQLVAPSQWMADCAGSSSLLGAWPVTVIPNALPIDVFRPHDQPTARDILRLPPDRSLIVFGAIGGDTDQRKGFELLLAALTHVAERFPAAEAVVFGAAEPRNLPRLPVPVRWIGPLHDDVTLALLYSAADVMVLPSRQDNLPQTGTEAQACGTPVVAFDATGLPDVVEDRVTGYLARPYEAGDLANGIGWTLEDRDRRCRLSEQARERATRLWAPSTVAQQYVDIYRTTIERARPRDARG